MLNQCYYIRILPLFITVNGNTKPINEKKKYTCIQTSLESPCTRICLNPLSSAYLSPKMTARYSAALFVATPKPSRKR